MSRPGHAFDSRIARELRGEIPFPGKPRPLPPPGWITSQEAATVLGVAYDTFLGLGSECLNKLGRLPRAEGSTTFRSCGAAYFVDDINRLAAIQRRCGLTLRQALRVLVEMKRGPL